MLLDILKIKNDLISLKEDLQKREEYSEADVQWMKAYLATLEKSMEKDLKDAQRKKYLAYTLTGLSIVSTIIAWLIGQPWYTQILVSIIAIIIIAGVLYYVYTSKDRRQAILDIINLIKEIIDIINDITPTPGPVKADFTANPLSGQVPLTVQFFNTSSGDPTSHWWSFGDGTTSQEKSPYHTYTKPGSYTVQLTVSNSQNTDTVTRQGLITVTEKPTPDPVLEHPPGVEIFLIGNVPIAKLGGENRSKVKELLAGGMGWPGLSEKIMDSTDPNLDVLPNYPFAYWYDGSYGGDAGWMLSQQGYYYEKNPITTYNTLHVIAHQNWLNGGAMRPYYDFTPLKEVVELKREGNVWVAVVNHEGRTQRIVLAQKKR